MPINLNLKVRLYLACYSVLLIELQETERQEAQEGMDAQLRAAGNEKGLMSCSMEQAPNQLFH